MLNMKVLDYRISSNENQVMVNKIKRGESGEIAYITDKDGNTSESVSLVGFYANLDMALKGIQRHYTMAEGTEIQTITDYRKALQEVQDAFEIELGL